MQMSAIPVAGLRLEFCADPGEFLAVAGDFLAADPVVSTVVTTVAHRLVAQQGGEISLVVEVAPLASTVLTLTSAMSRRLADLNIEVEFQFPGD